uniref:Uncharacterized protein n=1 Tax=Anopheles arabiensis TaxID=7173 RepID=A0A182IF48_ANOAR
GPPAFFFVFRVWGVCGSASFKSLFAASANQLTPSEGTIGAESVCVINYQIAIRKGVHSPAHTHPRTQEAPSSPFLQQE